MAWIVFRYFYDACEGIGQVGASAWVAAGAVVTKITFIPLAIVPFLILGKPLQLNHPRTWLSRERTEYLKKFFLISFLLVIPALPRARGFVAWIWHLSSHKGVYGTGEKGFVDTSHLLERIAAFFTESWSIPIYFVILVTALLTIQVTKRSVDTAKKPLLASGRRVLWAILLCVSLQIAMVVKHFETHYFFAGQLLLSSAVPIVFFLAKEHWPKKACMVAGFILSVLVLNISRQVIQAGPIQVKARASELAAVEALRKKNCPIQIYLNAGRPYALRWSREVSSESYTPVLESLYPGVYFYSGTGSMLDTWGREQIAFSKIRERHPSCIGMLSLLWKPNSGDSSVPFESIPLSDESKSVVAFEVR
jgi:hypothetical protein